MKQKDLLFILISVTFVVAAWIAFSVLHSSLTSTLTQQTISNTQPITSSFDTKTLSLLKKRTAVSPQNILPLSPTPTLAPITPIPSIASAPLASSGGIASGGGKAQ